MSTTPNNIMRNVRIAFISAIAGCFMTAILFAIALIGHCLLYYMSVTTLCIITAVVITLVIYFMACSTADAWGGGSEILTDDRTSQRLNIGVVSVWLRRAYVRHTKKYGSRT